ncbi:MAG: hypothetical protein OHK0046_17820 [Anaerolineae bacterium]
MKSLLVILFMLLSSTIITAQENAGFTVQLPTGWEEISTGNIAHASDPQTGAQFYALTALSVEEALTALDIVPGQSLEVTSLTLPNGDWKQEVFFNENTITFALSKSVNDLTHVMVLVAAADQIEALVPTVLQSIVTYTINGESTTAASSVSYPQPMGAYQVGRTQFGWTDDERPETYTEDPDDDRQVVVTVWYPTTTTSTGAAWISPELATAYADLMGTPVEALDNIMVHAQENVPLAEADAPFPVIIMSHGNGLIPALYTTYAEALASQGYVVCGVAHTYNASLVALPDGDIATSLLAASLEVPQTDSNITLLESMNALDEKGRQLVAVQAADLRFVLDEITRLNESDALFSGHLDLSKVGAFGHSFGGATAIEALLQDTRIDAAVDLDGSLFSDVSAGSERPTMMITTPNTQLDEATAEEIAAQGLTADEYAQVLAVSNRQRTLYEQSPQAYFVTIEDAQHMNFSDAGVLAPVLPLLSFELGAIDPVLALDITNAYLLAFFDQTLREMPSRLDDLPALYPQSTLMNGG